MGASASIDDSKKAEFMRSLQELLSEQLEQPSTDEDLILKLRAKAAELFEEEGGGNSLEEEGGGLVDLRRPLDDFGAHEKNEETASGKEGGGWASLASSMQLGEQDLSASIERLAASHVLERTAQFRLSMRSQDINNAKESFGRQVRRKDRGKEGGA